MKILQTIKEEIVPLSSRQHLFLLVIIACIFQFVLFYAPALADEAVQQAQARTNGPEDLIQSDSIAKDSAMDSEAAKLTDPALLSTKENIKIVRVSSHTITAYNSDAGQTDDSPCITANGFNVCEHGQEDTIAANFLPFGSKVMIPELFGDKVFIVRDRMNKKHANRVDVWMKDHNDAVHFGVKVATIKVLE